MPAQLRGSETEKSANTSHAIYANKKIEPQSKAVIRLAHEKRFLICMPYCSR